jgi:hypothetical protein
VPGPHISPSGTKRRIEREMNWEMKRCGDEGMDRQEDKNGKKGKKKTENSELLLSTSVRQY